MLKSHRTVLFEGTIFALLLFSAPFECLAQNTTSIWDEPTVVPVSSLTGSGVSTSTDQYTESHGPIPVIPYQPTPPLTTHTEQSKMHAANSPDPDPTNSTSIGDSAGRGSSRSWDETAQSVAGTASFSTYTSPPMPTATASPNADSSSGSIVTCCSSSARDDSSSSTEANTTETSSSMSSDKSISSNSTSSSTSVPASTSTSTDTSIAADTSTPSDPPSSSSIPTTTATTTIIVTSPVTVEVTKASPRSSSSNIPTTTATTTFFVTSKVTVETTMASPTLSTGDDSASTSYSSASFSVQPIPQASQASQGTTSTSEETAPSTSKDTESESISDHDWTSTVTEVTVVSQTMDASWFSPVPIAISSSFTSFASLIATSSYSLSSLPSGIYLSTGSDGLVNSFSDYVAGGATKHSFLGVVTTTCVPTDTVTNYDARGNPTQTLALCGPGIGPQVTPVYKHTETESSTPMSNSSAALHSRSSTTANSSTSTTVSPFESSMTSTSLSMSTTFASPTSTLSSTLSLMSTTLTSTATLRQLTSSTSTTSFTPMASSTTTASTSNTSSTLITTPRSASSSTKPLPASLLVYTGSLIPPTVTMQECAPALYKIVPNFTCTFTPTSTQHAFALKARATQSWSTFSVQTMAVSLPADELVTEGSTMRRMVRTGTGNREGEVVW